MFQVRAASLAGTYAVAAVVAGLARPGDIIVLAGEMGAGKTAFAQGFGAALGVTEPITSPTFGLVHTYPLGGRTQLLAGFARLPEGVHLLELRVVMRPAGRAFPSRETGPRWLPGSRSSTGSSPRRTAFPTLPTL